MCKRRQQRIITSLLYGESGGTCNAVYANAALQKESPKYTTLCRIVEAMSWWQLNPGEWNASNQPRSKQALRKQALAEQQLRQT